MLRQGASQHDTTLDHTEHRGQPVAGKGKQPGKFGIITTSAAVVSPLRCAEIGSLGGRLGPTTKFVCTKDEYERGDLRMNLCWTQEGAQPASHGPHGSYRHDSHSTSCKIRCLFPQPLCQHAMTTPLASLGTLHCWHPTHQATFCIA